MFYYLCKRCNHMTKQKIEMIRHLDKNKKCEIKDDDNKLSDNELYKNSLEKHEILKKIDTENNNKIEINNKQEDNYCNECNKYFYHKSNLNKHLKKNICNKKKNIKENCNECTNSLLFYETNMKENIQNICVQNHIINNNQINNNQINININYLKGFDEEWDVSKIDDNKKGEILLSNSKFSKILENILKNDVNLNVILNDNDIGIVYKNDKKKYEPMTNKDIIDKSMNKVYKHLKDFYNEIINNNINDISEKSLKNELNELEKKYTDFFKLEGAKNIVKNSFSNIYNTYKEDAENKYNELLEDENKYFY